MDGPSGDSLLQLIQKIVDASVQSCDLTVIPNLLLPQEWLGPIGRSEGGRSVAEELLAWFSSKGFECDRTRQNINGYPGLFRLLQEPPPWVIVEPEDCEGDLEPARELEIAPLYQHIARGVDVMTAFGEWADSEILNKVLSTLSNKLGVEIMSTPEFEIRRLVRLGQITGPEVLEGMFDAVFDYDVDFGLNEFKPAVGAPDLFVWTPAPLPPFWFFAEVKGPGDRLRRSQLDWINGNWQRVQGRVVLVSVV
jgi:VRR-NUC domain